MAACRSLKKGPHGIGFRLCGKAFSGGTSDLIEGPPRTGTYISEKQLLPSGSSYLKCFEEGLERQRFSPLRRRWPNCGWSFIGWGMWMALGSVRKGRSCKQLLLAPISAVFGKNQLMEHVTGPIKQEGVIPFSLFLPSHFLYSIALEESKRSQLAMKKCSLLISLSLASQNKIWREVFGVKEQ